MTTVRHQSAGMISKKNGTARALRIALLCGASFTIPAMFITAQAQVTESGDRTTPINTSTADDGAAADVILDGTVTVDEGTAVSVDSDNTFTNNGTIAVNASDDSVGVLLGAGFSGGFTNSGTITMEQSDAQSEGDPDSDLLPDYNDNRVAVLVAQGGLFTGDIILTSTSNITVFGDASAGFRIAGDLVGTTQIDGDFTITGRDSQAIAVSGDMTGAFVVGSTSSINVVGAGSTGILINGALDGAFVFGGAMRVTGYTDIIPDADDVEDNDNEAQLAQQGGAGIDINGDISGGVLIDGPVPSGQLREAEEGEDPVVNPPSAGITTFGASPALRITGATVGAVDTSALADPDSYGVFGLINRGVLNNETIYGGLEALAVLIDSATINGGIRNDGTMRSFGQEGDATTLLIRDSSVQTFFNSGIIEAQSFGTSDNIPFSVVGLLIEGASTLESIVNTGIINTIITGDNGEVVGVRDTSGSVAAFTNSGVVAARSLDDLSRTNLDTDIPVSTIAIDFSNNTGGVTITNTTPGDFDGSLADRAAFGNVIGDVFTGFGDDVYIADAGSTAGNLFLGAGNDLVDLSLLASIEGDIHFGDGDDNLTLSNASVIGDAFFGVGADVLNLSDQSTFNGTLNDADGVLSVNVATDSVLNINNADLIGISSLFVDATSTLGIAISDQGLGSTILDVAGLASFDTGATIKPIFLGGVPSANVNTFDIISAGTLDADIADLNSNLQSSADIPFLFNFSLDNPDGTNDLVLSVNRKTTEEIGISAGLAPALDPTIDALNRDLDLGVLIFNLSTQEEFQEAFGQLVAGPLDAPLAYARAQTNSVTSIITQRLDMARNSGEYGRTFWLQEETYFVNRDEDEASNGFDGGGFAIAAGVDASLNDTIDAIGLSASFSSARYDEQTGEDFPFNRVTYGLGAYGAASMGKLQFDARAEYSWADSDSERNVIIGGVRRRADAEWEGTQIAASGRVSYETTMRGYAVEPFASLDYLSLEEDGYTETGGQGINLVVADREADSLRTNIGVKAGKVFEIEPNAYDTGIPGTIHPQFTLAWSQELVDDDIEATYTYESGGESFTLLSEPEDGAAIVGADVAYENEYAKVHIGASGTFGDTTDVFILRAGVGLKW
ncbi:autotransporter outer membrane beta-barrel domain-containing protein [Parvularcula sp. IMCC14364]|uniref:autotransporter family protein n=1 Tax=Parvularcula sp. IMCC14364 TaxID=3067902 RepID=UPI0027418DF2|nr:autotransporter outer membrane beta-barrel domain-containing protein [Parvularcula sp. IMCC14364]